MACDAVSAAGVAVWHAYSPPDSEHQVMTHSCGDGFVTVPATCVIALPKLGIPA